MTNSRLLLLGAILTVVFTALLFTLVPRDNRSGENNAFFAQTQQDQTQWVKDFNGPHQTENGKVLVTMYKNEGCECCDAWARHMEQTGRFKVKAVSTMQLLQIKRDLGIRPEDSSCHTAVIGGLVVEGHVPREDVERAIDVDTDIIGLSVPGMPIGSPGMEIPGRPSSPYDVIAFNKEWRRSVYNSY